jgi:ribosome biogenesis GTPase / thiamine phosphate phosphatase
MTKQGLIISANSGFYYVKCDSGVVECHARGILRRQHQSPLVGDRVRITQEAASGTIEEILPRKNCLVRPPVANLDFLVIVVSTKEPAPNLQIIDRLIVAAEQKEIEPAVVVSKGDLGDSAELCDIYAKAGFPAFAASGVTGEGIDRLKALIKGRIGAFTGNSGVGKSSLLNLLDPTLELGTGEISHKLGRGRHTTRIVTLFETCGGYIADTPGFSSLDTGRFDPILKENLQYYFREFAPFLDCCRYTGCSHTKEQGCAVIGAVQDGVIAPSRHKSYCDLYEEAKAIKEWELKK